MQVIIDDRERKSGIAKALLEVPGLGVTIRRLVLGDYLWDDRLLFERKTLEDLVASLKDGRLLRQACQLASGRRRPILLPEGTGPVKTAMRREAIQGALITLTVKLGIPLLRSRRPEESARLMLYCARQVGLVRTRAVPRYQKARRPQGKRKVQLELLQGLPGVGPLRADELLRAFGSVEAVMRADVDELRSVSGIGRDTARGIRWAVSESLASYGLTQADGLGIWK